MRINNAGRQHGESIPMDDGERIASDASVWRAAQLMCRTGLPYVVVTEWSEDGPVPLGVLSAADIVMRVVARNLDVRRITVGDVLAEKTAPTFAALLRRL